MSQFYELIQPINLSLVATPYLIGYTNSSISYNITYLSHNTTNEQFNLNCYVETCLINEDLIFFSFEHFFLMYCMYQYDKQLKYTSEGVNKIPVLLEQAFYSYNKISVGIIHFFLLCTAIDNCFWQLMLATLRTYWWGITLGQQQFIHSGLWRQLN